MEMIEMSVSEQDEVDGWEVLNSQAATFDAFQQEQPVGEVRVDQDIKVGELDEERRVPDPGEGDLALGEFGKFGAAMLSGATGEQGFPDHLMKKRAWIEML